VKCRETASVGQPNYSSPATHSKPSEERTEKNKRKGGKKPRGKKRRRQGTRNQKEKLGTRKSQAERLKKPGEN
jgi:hypothetical protein